MVAVKDWRRTARREWLSFLRCMVIGAVVTILFALGLNLRLMGTLGFFVAATQPSFWAVSFSMGVAANGILLLIRAIFWFVRKVRGVPIGQAQVGASAVEHEDVVEPQTKPQKWRTHRAIIIILAITLLIVATCIVYRAIAVWRIKKEITKITTAGLPITLQELNDWYPVPPENENAAVILAAAFNEFHPENAAGNDLPLLSRDETHPLHEPLSEKMRSQVQEYVTANAAALALLHKAALMERCRYPVDLTDGFGTQMPHLRLLRHGCRLLALEATLAIEAGEVKEAVTSVQSAVALAHSLRNEPVLISQLVRIACRAIAVRSLEHVLNRLDLSDEQLNRLAEAFRTEEDSELLLRAMVGERCFGIDRFELLKDRKLQGELVDPLYKASNIYFGLGMFHRDYKYYLDSMGRFVQAARMPFPERLAAARDLVSQLEELGPGEGRHFLDFKPICAFLLPALGRSATVDANSMALIRMAATTLAVERYRLTYCKLPGEIGELIPDFMEAVPVDPFNGLPLSYKRLGRGFVIYSVGEDKKDNGGVEYPRPGEQGPGPDIVFKVVR